jgi:GntR family transcriptional regulator
MSTAALDRRSVLPLYYQIQQKLLKQIRSGAFKPGQAIPSEQEISARMGVSRMTARQALKSLCDLGVLYSQRGKGTFVSRIKLEKSLRQVFSFSEEMSASGSRPSSKVLAFELVSADIRVAEALHLTPEQQVISLRRVRLADAVPMGIECSRLPLPLCPDLLQTFDPRTSLYRALSERYGIFVAVTDEVVEASIASAEEARLLKIRKGSPVFRFVRISYLESGQPVEYVTSLYRGDRYKIANRLTAKPRR